MAVPTSAAFGNFNDCVLYQKFRNTPQDCKICSKLLEGAELCQGPSMNQRLPNLVLDLLARPSMPPPLRRRWRLWDIHRGIHGALLALSFCPDELRRLVRRAGVEIPPEARYYDIHRHLCEACTTPNELSELVEKALDQKLASKILMLRGLRSIVVVEDRWREAWRKARGLPALFWAFLTHPCATEELRAAFYADVHALFFNAVSEREKLLEKVEVLEHRIRALEKRRRADVRTLQEQLDRALKRSAAVRAETASSVQDSALRLRVALACQKTLRAKARVRTLEDRLRAERANRSGNPRLPQFATVERAAPEPKPGDAAGTDGNNVQVITRIPGVRIGYVGARPGSIERIRDFCEKRGAVFLDYDGGLEGSPLRLDQLLDRADVIFYPADCVIHEATLHVKAHCKRADKPSIPLRNASISTFRRAMKSWCGLT